ncbi:MAG: DUF3857 domain-containing protein [Bacteroidota bacterium]
MNHAFKIIVAAFLLSGLLCRAGTVKYPVSDIPREMLANADFVVRLSEMQFEVKSLNHAVWTEHLVVTILKESAAVHGILEEYYDSYTTIKSVDGAMFDAEGNLVKNFKSDDIYDHSAVSDGALYSDDRVKIIVPKVAKYPYTVEYFVEYSSKRILDYPSWVPRDSYRESVQSARLVIKAAEGLFPRVKTMRLPDNFINTGKGTDEESWEISDLKALEYEPLGPGIKNISPVILTAPTVYNVKGYKGDFSSWKSYGLWMWSLYEGRDTLAPEYAAEIQGAVDSEKDTILKVKLIYRYMQKKCRYVSTNVGIGGWQPVEANDVARLGYGDCKGLVNYTRALLKWFGIKSSCALVSSGADKGGILRDFPCNQFDHVILTVPMAKDTIWLECTNPLQTFGFLGSFCGGREVLLLTAGGGVLVRTPSYSKDVNILRTVIDITLDTNGNAEIAKTSVYRGLQYEEVEELLALNPEHLKEKVKDLYDMTGLTLHSIKMESSGDYIPQARESLTVKVVNYASVNGKRMFIPLSRFIDVPQMLKKDTARKTVMILTMPYIDYDTLVLHVPAGFTMESLPQSCNIKNQFGQLISEMKADGSTLKLYRKLEMEKGTYPAAAFNDFVTFLQQINRHDKTKVVLKR